MFKKEERYALTYISIKDGQTKTCYPQSTEKKDEQIKICKEKGIKIVSCKKLYPINTMKNQHNFSLINDIVTNELFDIWNSNKAVSDEEYERLTSLKERSEKYFCLPLPIAWLPWEEWKDAKEMIDNAVFHRQEACIANGRPDLVAYC